MHFQVGIDRLSFELAAEDDQQFHADAESAAEVLDPNNKRFALDFGILSVDHPPRFPLLVDHVASPRGKITELFDVTEIGGLEPHGQQF